MASLLVPGMLVILPPIVSSTKPAIMNMEIQHVMVVLLNPLPTIRNS